EVDGAGVLVLVEHLLPGPAAVTRAEYAALGVGAVGVAERRHEDHVRIPGVDQHAPDLLGVLETDARPGPAAVHRLVHAVPLGDVRAHVRLAGADVDHPRIRGCRGQRPDRADRLSIEDRLPGAAGVVSLPDAGRAWQPI